MDLDGLEEAAEQGHLPVLEWAKRRGFPFSQVMLSRAIQGGCVHVSQFLIDEGMEIPEDAEDQASNSGNVKIFEWLDKLACVEKYEGELDALNIYVNQARVDAGSVYELLALFRRYGVDMAQLRVFDREEFASWFRNPKSHWFKEVFG